MNNPETAREVGGLRLTHTRILLSSVLNFFFL